jgi:NhaA family Na+:H+ antiporter
MDPERSRTPNRPRVVGPLAEFLAAETTGALILLLATAAALIWANSPEAASYERFWTTHLQIRIGGGTGLDMDLRHWVNEAMMAVFFFVVGLEIKRQLVDGELRDRRRAAVPIIAAGGGMLAPALLYLLMNGAGSGAGGWGIPIATDIAFAIGALALFGRGAPIGLRVFLLSVAIADDIGSVLVIAAFYTAQIDFLSLGIAMVLILGVLGLWRIQAFWSDPPLVVLMVGVWIATLSSGVHPTIAGVVLGLLTPADPVPQPSPAERLEHALHPWTSYVVLPVFALANAGIAIGLTGIVAALSSPVTLGIIMGLTIGKLVGVSVGAYIAVRSGIGLLPAGVTWSQIVAVAGLAGIGFTVSLFIALLSFPNDTELGDQAKVGVLLGSCLSLVVGGLLLHLSVRRTS